MEITPERFYASQTEQSAVKARIVSKYFPAWAKVLKNVVERRKDFLRYVDLYAGPGRYEDGTKSTPLLILEEAIKTPWMHGVLKTEFNDRDASLASKLQDEIDNLPGIRRLRFQPTVTCDEVTDKMAEAFEARQQPPTLTFIDPFGYSGLSARLIRAALQDFASECVFFFNFNRLNPGVSNDDVLHHIRKLFDLEDIHAFRTELESLSPHDREEAVVEKMIETIQREPKRIVTRFRFKMPDGSRTSHYLFFATKNATGAKIMHHIMAKESSWKEGGLPGFEWTPKLKPVNLFDLLDPAPGLAEELLSLFAGRTLSVRSIREELVHRPEPEKLIKEALRLLEAQGHVTVTAGSKRRPPGTMADHNIIEFRAKE